jgi:hypothetical protein
MFQNVPLRDFGDAIDARPVDVRFTPKGRHRRETRFVTAVARIFPTKPSSFLSSQARSSAVRIFAPPVNGMQTKTDQIRAAWLAGDQIGRFAHRGAVI